MVIVERLQSKDSVCGRNSLIVGLGNVFGEQVQECLVIIDDQDRGRSRINMRLFHLAIRADIHAYHCYPASGKATLKVAPSAGWLSTQIRPCIASTNRLQM